MIVRKLGELANSERDVDWGNGRSRRFLIKADGMKYTLTDTKVNAGSSSLLEYTNHLEACYCIDGEGEVRLAGSDETHSIKPGTMYALDNNDKHYLVAKTDMRLVCVFFPALEGTETHNLSGSGSSSY